MIVGVYLRVSTDEQANEGYSLAEQERQCRAYCAGREWKDVRIYADEGISAFKDQLSSRPQLKQMLEDARNRKIGAVVVHKLDRFFRRAKLLIDTVEELLDRLKIPFISVSEQMDFSTPAGRVMLANLGAFAEYYSRNLSLETKKGLAGKARAGDWVGPVPFGYVRAGKTLEPSGDAWIVQAIFQRYASGDHSYTTLAQELNNEGLRLRHWRDGDKLFGRESIRSILGNPAYYGIVTCKGSSGIGRHAPLVDDALWERCAAIRKDRAETSNTPGIRGAGGLLTELAYCGTCGARLWYHRSGTRAHMYYRCGKRREYGEDGCTSRMMKAEPMDAAVLELIRHITIPLELQQAVIARAHELLTPQEQPRDIDPAKVRRQLERLRAAFLAGDLELTEEVYFGERKRLEGLLQSSTPTPPKVLDIERALAYLSNISETLDQMTPIERRATIRALISRVWLTQEGGVTQFSPTDRYAILVEASASVIKGCPTGLKDTSLTLPPRVYQV